ncbi:MAG TPA: hypothetical protein VHR66_08250 [Gemmataceae bacterium]|nr:hypothetical protein [Gemmataceae bacterium]
MSSLLNNAPPAEVDVETEFRRLAEWWNEETKYLSNIGLAVQHPAYRAIVALGPPVIPILLNELATKPDWWFDALEELTGASPLTSEIGGKVRLMAAKWVQWGRDNGYGV